MRAAGSTERRIKEESSDCSGTNKSDGETLALCKCKNRCVRNGEAAYSNYLSQSVTEQLGVQQADRHMHTGETHRLFKSQMR